MQHPDLSQSADPRASRAGTRQFAIRLTLLLVTAFALVWAASVLYTGGFVLAGPLVRISSRDTWRPLSLAAIAVLAYIAVYRRFWWSDATRLLHGLPGGPAAYGAAALTIAALFMGIHWGSFVAAGADGSGYVSQAELWLQRDLVRPRPDWIAQAPWPIEWPTTPLGYQPGKDPHRMVPMYSPGLPLVMALFQAVGGRSAVFVVVPLLGALAVWATYLLGERLAGWRVGLMSSLFLLLSPSFMDMLVQPMSDVPAAAFWVWALYLAARAGTASAVGAGVAGGFAVLTRPNLAPLGLLVAAIVVLRPERRILRLVVLGASALPAALAIGALNTRFYGGPLSSGYGAFDYLYSADRVLPNLARYAGWLVETQSPALLLAFASPFLWPLATRSDRWTRIVVTVAFPLAVLAMYLPYLEFPGWSFLRFLLPAYPGLLIGMAGVIVALAGFITRPQLRAAAIVSAALLIAGYGYAFGRGRFGAGRFGDQRYIRAATYVGELSPRSVWLSLTYSGSLAYYSGRETLRWEALHPEYVDRAVDFLRSKGYDVYLLGDREEIDAFRARFRDSRSLGEVNATTPIDLAGDPLIYALGGTEPPPAAPAFQPCAEAAPNTPCRP